MTDDEKLEIAREAFKRKLDSIQTWDQFKNTVKNLTSEGVITFIKNNLENAAISYRSSSDSMDEKAGEIDTLVNEIDGL